MASALTPDRPFVILGVPGTRVAVTFAAWVVLTLLTLSLPVGPWRGAVGELSHATLLGFALAFNARRMGRLPDERLSWSAFVVATAVTVTFTITLAVEAIWPDHIVLSPGVWLAQTVVSNGAVLVGLLALPYEQRSAGRRVRTGIDGVSFAIAAFLILWFTGLHDIVAASATPLVSRIEALFTYAANAAQLGIVVYLSARSIRRFNGVLGWLALGFLMLTIGTVLVLVGRLNGTFVIGSAAELVQLASYPCFILAPLAPAIVTDLEPPSSESALGDILIYAPVVLAVGTGLYGMLATQRVEPVAAIGTPILALLLLARQFFAIRDLRSLSATLEARVAERTRAVEASRAALVRAQRMEAVGHVTGGVAHDFNNVLAAILGSAELLQAETPPDDARSADVRTILEATSSGMRLTRQMLDFARRPTIEVRGVSNVHDVLTGLEWLMRSLRTHGVTCQVTPNASQAHVVMSATHVEQVMSNLLTNSREAMPNGGLISVSTRNGTIPAARATGNRGTSPNETWVCISVEDDGAGIPDSILPSIFEPFVSTKGESMGSGLGLATCYSLVHGVGGTIDVASRPGRTRFEIWLPSAA